MTKSELRIYNEKKEQEKYLNEKPKIIPVRYHDCDICKKKNAKVYEQINIAYTEFTMVVGYTVHVCSKECKDKYVSENYHDYYKCYK